MAPLAGVCRIAVCDAQNDPNTRRATSSPDADKWMSSSNARCDAFVKHFGEAAREFGMLIIDEAHTFDSVLGGHTCHLIERMDRLRQNRGELRIVMNSATVPGADEFMRKLVGDQRGNALVKVTAKQSDRPLVFLPRDRLLQESQAWNSNSRRRLLLFHAEIRRGFAYLLHSGPLQGTKCAASFTLSTA